MPKTYCIASCLTQQVRILSRPCQKTKLNLSPGGASALPGPQQVCREASQMPMYLVRFTRCQVRDPRLTKYNHRFAKYDKNTCMNVANFQESHFLRFFLCFGPPAKNLYLSPPNPLTGRHVIGFLDFVIQMCSCRSRTKHN